MKENSYLRKLFSACALLLFKLYDTSRLGDKLEEDIKLNASQKKALVELKKYGFSRLDNFLSKDECELIIREIENEIGRKHSEMWVDEQESDHRLFGINNVSNLISNLFTSNEYLYDLARVLSNRQQLPCFTLGAKLQFADGNLGSGMGWHRDSLGFQFKAMLYLNDVNELNGPFEYYSGSHKMFYKIKNYILDIAAGFKDIVRYKDVKINKLLGKKNLVTFVAPAGTLILFNSSGVHRGSPIKHGVRYALTNYYFNSNWGKNWDEVLIKAD
jgi:hypothetical protein